MCKDPQDLGRTVLMESGLRVLQAVLEGSVPLGQTDVLRILGRLEPQVLPPQSKAQLEPQGLH